VTRSRSRLSLSENVSPAELLASRFRVDQLGELRRDPLWQSRGA
jgi:hypothetical protein